MVITLSKNSEFTPKFFDTSLFVPVTKTLRAYLNIHSKPLKSSAISLTT